MKKIFGLILTFYSAGFLLGQTGVWKSFDISNGLANNDVRSVELDGDNLWFGTYGGGLSLYQKSIDKWSTFSIADSLSDFINSIAVDGKYIWVGTDIGACLFDKNKNELKKTFQTVHCISNITVEWDAVWFSTFGKGVYKYTKANGIWTNFDSTSCGLLSNSIIDIEVQDDRVWFATKSGVNCYHKSTGIWESYTLNNSGIGGDYVFSIEVDGNDIWMGHAPSPIITGHYETVTHTYITDTYSYNGCSQEIRTGGTIYPETIFFPSVSHLMNNGSDTWNHYECSWIDTLNREKYGYLVSDIVAGSEVVCFATFAWGLFLYNKSDGSLTNFNTQNSNLPDDFISAVAIDGNDIWVCTSAHGVSRYRAPAAPLWKCYRKTDGLLDESIQAIGVFGDEAWFGTRMGMSRLQISTGTFQNYDLINSDIGSSDIQEIEVDSHNVWFSSFFIEYEEETQKVIYTPALTRYWKEINFWEQIDASESQLGNHLVRAISMEGDEIWFGAEVGQVSNYNKLNNNWTHFNSTITRFSHDIWDLDVSGDEVWFATFGGGVGCYNKNTNSWDCFTVANSGLVCDSVYSVGIDMDYVWFGTFGKGISRYQRTNDEWVTFNTTNTLVTTDARILPYPEAFDYIYTIAVEGDFVWFGSSGWGVFLYQKSTGLWEVFNHRNSPIPGSIGCEVYDIHVYGRYVWIAAFYEDYSGLFPNIVGGVCRYGDVTPPELIHSPITDEQPSEQPVLILTSIVDNKDICSAEIQYRLEGSFEYNTAELNHHVGDLWLGQIPPHDVVPGVLGYYISVTDGRNITTHPYSSPVNSPHRFYVYDSVPPMASISIASTSGSISDTLDIHVSITVDGTGSLPTLEKVTLVQYGDYSAEGIIDTTEVSLAVSWEERNENRYLVSGLMNVGFLKQDVVGIKVRVTVRDEGHDEQGNPLVVHALSNPIFRFTGGINVNAEKGKTLSDPTGMATLYIPPHALQMDTYVKIAATFEPSIEGVNIFGPAFDIIPQDIILNKPATLTISLREEDWQKIENLKHVAIHKLQRASQDSVWSRERIGGQIDVQEHSVTTVINKFGTYAVIEDEAIQGESSISQVNSQPRVFSPNNGEYTTISFELGRDSEVTVKVFNLAGRLVRTLKENVSMTPGMNPITWDGKDYYGNICKSGMYIVTVQSEGQNATKTVMVLNK